MVPSLRCSHVVARSGVRPVTNSVRAGPDRVHGNLRRPRDAASRCARGEATGRRGIAATNFSAFRNSCSGGRRPVATGLAFRNARDAALRSPADANSSAAVAHAATNPLLVGRELLFVAVCNGKNCLGRAPMVLLVGLHDADHFERLFDMPATNSLIGFRLELMHELVQRRQCTNWLALDHREALANAWCHCA